MTYPFYTPYGIKQIEVILFVMVVFFICFIIAIWYRFCRIRIRQDRMIIDNPVVGAEPGQDTDFFPPTFSVDPLPSADSSEGVHNALEEKERDLAVTKHSRRLIEIRWETLFISAAEAILIGDEDGPLICNPRFEKITGVSYQDIIGMKIMDLPFRSIIGDGMSTLHDIWEREGDDKQFIWKISPDPGEITNGKEIILDTTLQFVEMDGRRLRFLIAHDITEETRLREEQEIAIRQIDRNLGQLAALNDEIRNPLTLIAAWTELDSPPNRAKIMDGVRRINEIIDRIDTGYVESEKVRKFLQKSIEGYRPE
jgi:PAS domain S-box-containing protein